MNKFMMVYAVIETVSQSVFEIHDESFGYSKDSEVILEIFESEKSAHEYIGSLNSKKNHRILNIKSFNLHLENKNDK